MAALVTFYSMLALENAAAILAIISFNTVGAFTRVALYLAVSSADIIYAGSRSSITLLLYPSRAAYLYIYMQQHRRLIKS